MANVRCPMCSKVNTPDADTCVYCGARLKPVRPPSAPAQVQKPEAAQPGDEPDWLRQIRQDTPAASTPSAPSASQAEEAEEIPDWLSRIRSREKDEESGAQNSGALDSGARGGSAFSAAGPARSEPEPDWLRGLQGDQPADFGAAEEPTDQFDLGNDWLNRLQDQTDSRPAAAETGAADFGASDWLQSFSDQPAQETAASSDFSGWGSEPSSTEQDFSGWMSEGSAASQDFPGWGSEPAPSVEPAKPADDEDWLNKLSAWGSPAEEEQPAEDWNAPQQPAATAPAEGEDLGWLNTLGFDAEQPPAAPEAIDWAPVEEPAPEPEQRESSGFGLTGFLAGLEETSDELSPAADAAAPAVEPEESDWFNRFSAQDDGPFADTAPAAAEPVEPGVPEWLRGGPDEAPLAAEQPPAGEGLPAWLSGGFDAGTPTASAEPASTEAGLPDWLAGDQETTLTQGQAEAASPAEEEFDFSGAAAAGGLPAWLSGEEETGLPQPTVGQAAESQPAPFDFAAMEEEAPLTPTPVEQGPALQGEEGMPDWFSSFSEAEETEAQPGFSEDTQPTWLTGVASTAGEEKPTAEAAEPAPAPFIDENVPDWLRDFNTQRPSAGEDAVAPLIGAEEPAEAMRAQEIDQPFSVDLPDWLAEDAAAQAAEPAAALPADDEQLAQAELPEWVKDMRPIESVIPGEAPAAESDQRMEKAGPLAGVPGILPAEEMVAHYRKLPVYSVKLRVTEKQRSHAALLESILAQETQPVAIPAQRSHAPRIILHILIALLLLFALTAPRVLQMDALAAPAAAPGLAPDELQDMFETIDGRVSQDSAPVLVAVDYEPGLSGEMRLAAAPVIDHLMARNASIVMVSTIPSGPALAQRLLTDAGQNHANYNLAEQTVNLGYLPGGAISLVEFARQPQLAAPVTFYGEPAWQRPILSQVTGLQSFAQVIVLTDSPETGRAWVEQVQPAMGAVPLLLVSSAQAAPMLEPFVQSGQVQGMVSGMLGGLMYSQQAGQANNPVTPHYASYQVGVLLAFVLVLLGGLISGARAAFTRRGREKEEE